MMDSYVGSYIVGILMGLLLGATVVFYIVSYDTLGWERETYKCAKKESIIYSMKVSELTKEDLICYKQLESIRGK